MKAFRRSCVNPRLVPLLVSVAALLAWPRLLPAGSTGTAALHMPQGNKSGIGEGDYVSDATGLNSPYRYFIEVLPGLPRLQVQIFDPDIGLGGSAEDTAGRDHRRGIPFDTAASYTLIDPDGIARTTRFTTGNVIKPAGSDNAWLDLYNATGNDVRDDFGTASFSNDDGNNDWSGGWIEADGGGDGPTTGAIQVVGGELRLQDGVPGAPQIEREADLLGTPGLNMGMAYLTFTYRTSGDLESSDQVRVQVSGNGGATWMTLETFVDDGSGSRTYEITAFIADNTRVRFLLADGVFTGSESFYVDNLRISDGPVTSGHWELQVDLSSDFTAGDDVDAIGIRAGDGDFSSGGTELNVYADSHVQIGVNPPSTGTTTRSYTLYPYVTSGCSFAKNDFDYEANRGNSGSMSFTSRSGSFSQSYAGTSLSGDRVWRRDSMTGWTSDADATDYGVWTGTFSISPFLVFGILNGNYAGVYMSSSQAPANPPTANPTAGAFRIYLPTDAGTAPVKPYMTQQLRHGSGPNPPQVGQTSRVTITVRVVNLTSRAITFSASNLVTATVPGNDAVYAAAAQVSQGAIVGQPGAGEIGDVIWNPGTLSAGATAFLSYEVSVTPTSPGQRIAVTNGTRAQYVDETGNATQRFGPLCDLAVTQGILTQAVLSSFRAAAGESGGVLVEWTTASEEGTAGFLLSRWDSTARRWVRLQEGLLPGLIHEPQGGTYRFLDEGAAPGSPLTYLLEEVEVGGRRRPFGPFTVTAWERQEGEGFVRAPHPALRHASPVERKTAFAATGEGVHLAIRETGLYYLSTPQVATWLGTTQEKTEKDIAKGRMLLTRGGLPVAWYPDLADGLRGQPKTARGLFFYGEALDSLYSRDTVYRLQQANAGLIMQTASVAPSTAVPAGASFPESLAVETDAFPATAISPDPESDYWFWAFLVAGDPTFGHKTFTLDAPGLATGPTTLQVDLQGATDTHTRGEHRAAVSVNGMAVGELQWQGIAPRQGTFAVPAGVLRPAGNQVEVMATVGGGAPYSILYVDGFRLGYRRVYEAVGDVLAFPGETAVTVSGFSSPAVRLLDVSDPLRPLWLTGAAVANSSRLSFVPSAAARYLAAGNGGLKSPTSVRPWSATDLRSTSFHAKVLIVVPPGLKGAAERLADLRRSQGLESFVVDLDEVADSFGHGTMTPHVLRSFLAWAWQRWEVPPRYVVLVGEGSLDYRNLLGYGDCLLPPRLVQAERGLFPADNRLADATGDGRPDMAIGRIPVRTAAELDGYVDKILAYESRADPARAANVLLLADRPDGAADFPADSDRIAGLLPSGYAVDRIYLSTMTLEAARAELFQGLGRGASLVNFLGHGGLDRLSGSGLLTSADVPGLANSARLPVLTAMTCTINRYDVPGVPSLGELLVRNPEGGAVAVWAPSGLAYHGESRQLAELFYRLASEPDVSRLGDRILRALTEFDRLGGNDAIPDTYNLLGDPSLLVQGRRW